MGAIRDHHGHHDYLADGMHGDRLRVYDGLDGARVDHTYNNSETVCVLRITEL